VSKGLPDHWEIVVIQGQPYDVFHADPLRIAAPQSIGDVQRAVPAFARAAQQTLIPAAGSQFIPDERGNAPGLADSEPGRTSAARDALPPIPCHGSRTLTHIESAPPSATSELPNNHGTQKGTVLMKRTTEYVGFDVHQATAEEGRCNPIQPPPKGAGDPEEKVRGGKGECVFQPGVGCMGSLPRALDLGNTPQAATRAYFRRRSDAGRDRGDSYNHKPVLDPANCQEH
jgi:hypothetical protein